MNDLERADPPLRRLLFISPGPADLGEVVGARFWSGGRSGWCPCSQSQVGLLASQFIS